MKKPMYRIKEKEGLFYCEYKEYAIFNHTWKPFVKFRGLDEAYGFSSQMNAENALLMEIKRCYIINE